METATSIETVEPASEVAQQRVKTLAGVKVKRVTQVHLQREAQQKDDTQNTAILGRSIVKDTASSVITNNAAEQPYLSLTEQPLVEQTAKPPEVVQPVEQALADDQAVVEVVIKPDRRPDNNVQVEVVIKPDRRPDNNVQSVVQIAILPKKENN